MILSTDRPHPICPVPMPNDGDLTGHLADWRPDADIRPRVLVDNPTRLTGFWHAMAAYFKPESFTTCHAVFA